MFPGDGAPGGAERTAEGALGTDVQLNHPTDLAADRRRQDAGDGVAQPQAAPARPGDRARSRSSPAAAPASPATAADHGASRSSASPRRSSSTTHGNLYILDQQNFRVRQIDADRHHHDHRRQRHAGRRGRRRPRARRQADRSRPARTPSRRGGLARRRRQALHRRHPEQPDPRHRPGDRHDRRLRRHRRPGLRAATAARATAAQLARPRDLEIGPDGDLYVADTDNNGIRAIDLATASIRTVAGTGELGLDAEDELLATETTLAAPVRHRVRSPPATSTSRTPSTAAS